MTFDSAASAADATAARGRPRDPTIEEKALGAALELIAERGLEATTIDAVAARSGVARATLYRRWVGRDGLVEAAIRRAIGRQPLAPTGDIEIDASRAAKQARAIVSEPLFVTVFPEIARELLRGGPVTTTVTYDGLFPGRRWFADEYRALAAGAALRSDLDPALPLDLIVGAQINRLLATGKGPSADLVRQIVEVVLAGLRSTAPKTRQ